MADIHSWLKQNLSSFEPNEFFALNATRHMSQIERKKLFSPQIEHMRTAEGRWYEAIMYEMFLEIAAESDQIKYLAMKGADVSGSNRKKIRLGQNGLFYSRCGDITIRGNGQDLAEFDLLLIDQDDKVAFAEVVTSASDMKEFEQEIDYKRKLLGYLFDQERVTFLLISSFDVTNFSVGRRLLKSPKTVNIQTISCEEIKSSIAGHKRNQAIRQPDGHPKLIPATGMHFRQPFEYLKYHDGERDRIFSLLSDDRDVKSAIPSNGTAQLVKKILYGGLYPSAIRSLCNDHKIRIKGQEITYPEIMHRFSKVVLATDLPGYEPLVYLRTRHKKEYLKMVQDKDGNFKFERYTPSKVGFFLWLESLNPALGARISGKILDAFSPSPN